MKRKTISKTHLLVTTAVAAFVGPRLAKDKKFDVVPYFKGLTAKSYKDSIKPIMVKLAKDVEPMLAPEAGGGAAKMGPDDVIHMLASHIIGGEAPSEEAIKTDEIPMGAEGEGEEGMDNAPLMKFLSDCGLDEAALAKVKEMLGGSDANVPTGSQPGSDEDDDDDKVTKEAMDKAIAKAAKDSADRVKREMTETAEAREYVRPWVGTVPMALDSAVKVLQAACGTLKIDGADKVADAHALRLLIGSRPQPGARAEPVIAQDGNSIDADTMKALAARFPHAAGINVQG